jgi:hypothetical protein
MGNEEGPIHLVTAPPALSLSSFEYNFMSIRPRPKRTFLAKAPLLMDKVSYRLTRDHQPGPLPLKPRSYESYVEQAIIQLEPARPMMTICYSDPYSTVVPSGRILRLIKPTPTSPIGYALPSRSPDPMSYLTVTL